MRASIAAYVIIGVSLSTMNAMAFTPSIVPPTRSRSFQPETKLFVAGLAPQEVKPSDLFDDDLLTDMESCLRMLEKRVETGPGALSSSEVSDFEAAMGRIMADMGAPPSGTSSPAVTDADASTPAVQVPQPLQDLQSLIVNPYEDQDSLGAEEDAPHLADPVLQASSEESDNELSSAPDSMQLRIAVSEMDSQAVSALLDAGLEMDEETANAAFWQVVSSVDRSEKEDKPLSADVPRMLHHIFDADMRHLLMREKQSTNITCMKPDDSDGMEGAARRMNYIFDDSSLRHTPLTEGRVCEGGNCCEACSRNIFPTFATTAESDLETFQQLESLTFNNLHRVPTETILQFVRLVERVRRTMAHEYGLPLSSILPLQAYSRKYVAGTTQKGGGGGEGDFVTLHADEATHAGYHYSCVLYLSDYGVDFEGGAFVFNDPADPNDPESQEENLPDDISFEDQVRRAGRKLTPFYPTRGSAVIFSSGWENLHEVEQITAGTRYVVPCFFTTCPVPEAAYEQMVAGKPKTDDDIADDWLHLLLAHQKEDPMISVGRVKELLMKWHYICTPLSQH